MAALADTGSWAFRLSPAGEIELFEWLFWKTKVGGWWFISVLWSWSIWLGALKLKFCSSFIMSAIRVEFKCCCGC